jgi:hypothetical protein
MVTARSSFLLAFVLLVASSARAGLRESTLLGSWCAGSASAFHESFSLTVEDGAHVFSSWLHDRPAESGTWNLAKRTLTIHGRSGTDYVYAIESATSKRLVLRQGQEKAETYVRDHCRKFDAPPGSE